MLVRQYFYGNQSKENPLYDNRYKAEKRQLLPLSLDLLLHGVKVEQVAEHRLLGIIIDNIFR